ncbi:MAG: hypothetical protein R3195_03665 [Gemmatimonadota bacterium]|nr:hypothetical protein [Gemmatimonadota bacterium]
MRWSAGVLPLLTVFIAPALATAQDRGALIENAVSAAPSEVSGEATVVGLDQTVLREGSNGWVCMPDDPDRPGDSPMCLDGSWLEWAGAWMSGAEAPPAVERVGIGYMLQGDFPASNVDPFATGPDAGNEWMTDGAPHIMLLVPREADLEGLPTMPGSGPWVMWRDTPYVHLMIPIENQP